MLSAAVFRDVCTGANGSACTAAVDACGACAQACMLTETITIRTVLFTQRMHDLLPLSHIGQLGRASLFKARLHFEVPLPDRKDRRVDDQFHQERRQDAADHGSRDALHYMRPLQPTT